MLFRSKKIPFPASLPMAVYNDTIINALMSNSYFQEENAQTGLPEPFSDLVGKVAIDDNPVLMFYTVHL